jgi:hypothetical protein
VNAPIEQKAEGRQDPENFSAEGGHEGPAIMLKRKNYTQEIACPTAAYSFQAGGLRRFAPRNDEEVRRPRNDEVKQGI